MSKTVNVQCSRGYEDPQFKRLTLPEPIWKGQVETGVGNHIEALYYGPKSGRMFVYRTTQWQGGRDYYEEITKSEFLNCCELIGIDTPAGIKSEIID